MICILAIGNSFSQDATHYLHQIAEADGIETKVVNLYIGGCNLERHWQNIVTGAAEYLYELNGHSQERYVSVQEILAEEAWDVIITQQASHDSGWPDSYDPFLDHMVAYIRERCPTARLYMQKTWAYELDSTHSGFIRYHNSQKEMFERLSAAYQMASDRVGVPLIPCGDIIQALRGEKPFQYETGGLSLCRDGFHMSYIYGRYALAAAWYGTLTGRKLEGNSYIPQTSLTEERANRDLLKLIQKKVDEIVEKKLMRKNFHIDSFGENVWFFAPEDDPVAVRKELEMLWERQEANQFGDARYAVYFFSGKYDELIQPKVGFYTQVSGLGKMPDDVSLYTVGCDARWLESSDNHNATCNFWRGVENLSARDMVTWAVSQATFMRRVHIEKNLYLHDSNGWCSGGFLSNSWIGQTVDSGSQQQWLSRNCDWNAWTGENWNIVFAGIAKGKVPEGTWPQHAYTDASAVREIREKPFLVYDGEKGFGVCLPDVRTEASGIDWAPGAFIPMTGFYIAKSCTDTAETMNKALSAGKHLFLTPGIYQLTEPLRIEREGMIVLGTGLATLCSAGGKPCMEVADRTSVTIAGILFDAGPAKTEALLVVGNESKAGVSEIASPSVHPKSLLADLFFRVGGAREYDTDVRCCVKLYQDGIIGDNFWVWRADHGSGVGWNRNRAANGILAAGNDITIYALMVEHFQEYQTVWEGENGKIVFYQCEIPYDVPDQKSWKSHKGSVNGFSSLKIADSVKSHEAWGLGIYLYNRDAEVELYSAVEAPEDAEEIRVHHICTVMITGNPGMSHIINGAGDAVMYGGARAVLTEW